MADLEQRLVSDWNDFETTRLIYRADYLQSVGIFQSVVQVLKSGSLMPERYKDNEDFDPLIWFFVDHPKLEDKRVSPVSRARHLLPALLDLADPYFNPHISAIHHIAAYSGDGVSRRIKFGDKVLLPVFRRLRSSQI